MTDGWTVPGFTRIRELGPARGPAGRDGRASGPVVLAVDDITQTQVAIKLIPSGGHLDLAMIRRLGRVEDPNVIGVYEAVEGSDGSVAIIMELVEDAVGLRRILATQGPTGPLGALSVFSGSLLGLAVAHQAGVLHGDYGPGRLLVGKDGVARLFGFGLGMPSNDGTVGDPAYLAPERWDGAPLSPAADLYAATALFFECLTGHQPYPGRKAAELARAHRSAPIPVEEVPGPLQVLIARGLAKDPAQRPASAAEFVGELEDAAVAAYGLAWESQGRSRMAEMALRAATAPDPAPPTRRRRAESPGRTAGSLRSEAPGSDEFWRTESSGSRGDGSRSGGVGGVAAAGGMTEARRPDGSLRTDPVFSPPGGGSQLPPGQFGEGLAGEGLAGEAFRGEAYGGEAYGKAEASTASGEFGSTGVPRTGYSATHASEPSGRRSRSKSRRGLLVGAAVVTGAIAVAGVGFTVLRGGGAKGNASSTERPQTPPDPAGSASGSPASPEAAALADQIAKAVDAHQTATFNYHGPGGTDGAGDAIDATGVLRASLSNPGSYDLTVWNSNDKRYARHLRTILVGDTGYVLMGGWRQAPAERTPGKDDIAHVYATMAANTRWAGSPLGLLGVLRASTTFREAGGVATGTSTLSALAADPGSGPLWSSYDDAQYRMSYVLKIGPDDLPQRLDVRLDPKAPDVRGGPSAAKAVPLLFRTLYSRWGHKVAITTPTPGQTALPSP